MSASGPLDLRRIKASYGRALNKRAENKTPALFDRAGDDFAIDNVG
jgi:hypothetical protein